MTHPGCINIKARFQVVSKNSLHFEYIRIKFKMEKNTLYIQNLILLTLSYYFNTTLLGQCEDMG